MRNLIFALLSVLSFASFAQTEKSASDTTTTTQTTRADIKFMAGLPYRVQKNITPRRIGFYDEIVAASAGGVQQVNSISPTSGNIVLTTNNIAENTNLYYTQTRARSAISATGAITYNSTTGAITFSGTKSDVGLANVDNTSDLNKPVSTATTTALALKENAINAGTTAQYFRGDKTFQTLNSSVIGLGSVDNTSDAAKPVSTAQATAIALKADATSVIPVSSVSAYSNLTGVTAPASGFLKFVRVATDERYTETNSLYFLDSAGKILKVATIKEN